MQKIGLSLQGSYSKPMPEVLKLLRAIGFDAVSPVWQRDGDLAEIVRHAREQSLTVQSLHGPVRGMPAVWSPDPEIFQPILRDLLQSAIDCNRYEIPVLVIHPWNGVEYTFRKDSLYFAHFDTLVTLAEQENITIAFENLEGPEYLAALMERYRGSNAVGFCWDSGHERCYTPGWEFLSRYGHRLVMTHLNDNYGVTDPSGQLQGTDDLHLLPYDGNLDWPHTIDRLKQAKRQEILNFELKIRPKGDRCKTDLYSCLPLEEYFAQAYERACRAITGYFE